MTEAVQVALVVAIPGTIGSLAAVLAAIGAWRNSVKLNEIHIDMDGRFTQMLAMTKQASHAEGVLDEKDRIKTPANP
jgi:hypothetical protein